LYSNGRTNVVLLFEFFINKSNSYWYQVFRSIFYFRISLIYSRHCESSPVLIISYNHTPQSNNKTKYRKWQISNDFVTHPFAYDFLCNKIWIFRQNDSFVTFTRREICLPFFLWFFLQFCLTMMHNLLAKTVQSVIKNMKSKEETASVYPH
jgi:hypothetical protein